MSRSADISVVVRRSAALAACGLAALVMLITGHIGWAILSCAATVGGAMVAAGSIGELRSGKARAAVAVPAVVTVLGLIAAY
ncbi:hypothetical protein [Nocardioides nematodiphilus]|uniref:hypothetical protein n=1 Tax=Nocardioides nematodiphilus TaxID=2849669 RepID=UPI001CD922CC|nr:hypothetical protein [Nocardioides nematodiphilus]MCA1983909.1 hypothetical protein [Nocardioides nematodiphilus]